MEELTIETLKMLSPHVIFDQGVRKVDGEMLKWVAVRGKTWDWSIYYSLDTDSPPETIAVSGHKVHDMKIVRKLRPFDMEAEKVYRH